MQSVSKHAIGLLLCLVTCGAGAADGLGPRWTFKGFGTLGATGTDTDVLGFRRDLTQFNAVTSAWRADTDSRLGLQLDVDINQSLHAGAQWVARNHAGDFIEQNLDWAYLRWSPVADVDIRVGRLGFDVFMLSDYRNVGYAYPWMRPPQDFYSAITPYHFDGADIVKRVQIGGGTLAFKIYGGFLYEQVPGFNGLYQVFDSELGLGGGTLTYEVASWRWKAAYVYSQTLNEVTDKAQLAALNDPALNAVWPGASSLISKLDANNTVVQYGSLGVAYDDGIWIGQLEGGYFDSTLSFFPSMAMGYLSVGKRINSVTLYTLLGMAKTFNYRTAVPSLAVPVPQLVASRNFIDQALNNNGVDQKSLSLGVRWDVYENIALKAQWSHYWLGNDGTQLWVEPQSGPVPANVNVFSLGVDFVF